MRQRLVCEAKRRLHSTVFVKLSINWRRKKTKRMVKESFCILIFFAQPNIGRRGGKGEQRSLVCRVPQPGGPAAAAAPVLTRRLLAEKDSKHSKDGFRRHDLGPRHPFAPQLPGWLQEGLHHRLQGVCVCVCVSVCLCVYTCTRVGVRARVSVRLCTRSSVRAHARCVASTWPFSRRAGVASQ